MVYVPEDESNLLALLDRTSVMDERMEDPKFTYTRNGIRLAIAAMGDELEELWEEWNRYKRTFHKDDKVRDHRIRHELLDVAAIAMLALRNVPDEQD